MSGRAADREARFKAFISYSHKDAAAARRLHRRLENYRIPKRLAGSEGADGPVPARLTPIFRDREDFPAAGDLSETVRAALGRSENLIVLCSPDAAASQWVGREIALFRELHPGRPVYAAIVAGEPAYAFPPELTAGGRIEPLAADLRGKGDGRRLGFLKLAAGLAGVGLDALVQRDGQRRMRRVMAVTALALIAVLVMAVLTTMALSARAEAERQRAEAEGLVEFMLTDLRDRLKGVGSLEVMQAVNQRALVYYGSRADLKRLSDASLARRARILHAIGDDNLARDDLSGALAAFSEAQQTTAEQVARAPNNPERLFEHAKTDFGIGRVYELQHDWPRAERHYSAFAQAAEQLVRKDGSNPDYLLKAASAAIDLGNVALGGRKDHSGAEAWYRKALGWLTEANRLRPADHHIQMTHANAHAWLADAFYGRCAWPQSLAARQSQFAIVEKLRADHPRDWEVGFRYAAAGRGLAYALAAHGDKASARLHLLDAQRTAAALTSRDAHNAEWKRLHDKLTADLAKPALPVPKCTNPRGARPAPNPTHH
ncbi:MAG TPA: TIR domain-containing protein [Allosphingosinicella sp.]|jgi:hypothetical protein